MQTSTTGAYTDNWCLTANKESISMVPLGSKWLAEDGKPVTSRMYHTVCPAAC